MMATSDRQRRDAITEMIVAETSCEAGDLADGKVHICERDPADRARFAACAYPAPRPGTKYDPMRPIGVATVCADSDALWQIGIDVEDEHQGRGVGLAIASAAAVEVVSQGRVPYWGASNSNIRSQRAAMGAGLVLTYVEVLIRPVSRPTT